jgi:mannose-6-phosphate isomerase
MDNLYPIKFKPLMHDRIWGGNKLSAILNKPALSEKAGESWEISAVDGNLSTVSNGFLEGNNLEELIEVYMGDLVGERIFEKYGLQFPLLIKFIDANDKLSIQVHPDDELAMARHNSFGKTEMWYVLQADDDAELIVGFNQKTNQKNYLKHLESGTLQELLHTEKVKPGDVFFLPAGRVHAIGAGILLAEVQQTSDITYRIYDFKRRDANGKERELHTEQALQAINFEDAEDFKTKYKDEINKPVELITCPYFTTNMLHINHPVERDFNDLDCFVIYMCVEGSCQIVYDKGEKINLRKGETVLIPAILPEFTINPNDSVKLLEVYIDEEPQTETEE